MTQQFHFLAYIWNNWSQDLEEKSAFHIHCSIIHSSQDMEVTEVSINRCMDKDVIYLCLYIYIYIYIYIHIYAFLFMYAYMHAKLL